MANQDTTSRAKRWTLNFITITFSIALALLYVLVLRSISVQITPPPGPETEPYPDVSTQALCEEAGGRWVERGTQVTPTRIAPVVTQEDQAFCQGPLRVDREREQQHEKSQQTMLFVFAVGGALAVASSLLIDKLKPVAPGLMLGGIAAFFVAGIQIWVLAPGWGRLVTIIAIFLILVGVGMSTLKDKKE